MAVYKSTICQEYLTSFNPRSSAKTATFVPTYKPDTTTKCAKRCSYSEKMFSGIVAYKKYFVKNT
jgi:hypothetical protein